MDLREKLIELIYKAKEQADKLCDLAENCEKCPANRQNIDCLDWLEADCLLALGVTVREWIPVTERLPEDDLPKDTKKRMIKCFVYTDKGSVKPCVRQRWEHFDGQLVPWQWNKDLFAKPTHWMYYPEPPKEEL